MARDEVRELFRRQQDAWNARDAAALTAGHAEDGTIVSPIFRKVHGRREILESYESLFTTFPDWRYEGNEALVDGDRVAQPFRVKATHSGEFMGIPGTGRMFDIEGVRLVCVSYLEPGTFKNARYQVRRLRKTIPGVPVIALFWGLSDDNSRYLDSIEATECDIVTTGLKETLRHILAFARRADVVKAAQ